MEVRKPKIVFIHGAWVTPGCWDNFISFFSVRGYECVAPAWPGKEAPIAEQQAHPNPSLAGMGIRDIVAHYEEIIHTLPEPPILIGHSFGGLITQILLGRGLGEAGVAISPAPPKGVPPYAYPSLFFSNAHVLLKPCGWRKIVRWPFKQFARTFAPSLPEKTLHEVHAGFIVPETGRIFFEAALAPFHSATKVDFNNKSRAPLLIVAGGDDLIVPPGLNRANYLKQKAGGAPTEYKEFPGKAHALIVMEGWEEIAEYCAVWLEKTLKK